MMINVTVKYSSDSLRGVSEREAVPGGIVSLDSMEVYDVLLARCARHATKWFLSEHGIFLIIIATCVTALHKQLIEILQLFLQ